MKLGLGLGFNRPLTSVVEPLIASTGAISPTEYSNSFYDSAGGGAVVSLTYTTPTNPNANECPLYIGDPSTYQNRAFQLQWDGATPENEMRVRVRDTNVEKFAEDKNFTISYVGAKQKHAGYYNAATGRVAYYFDGIKVMDKTGGVTFPTSANVEICVGKINGITSLNTAASITDFVYYGSDVSETTIRNLSRNNDIVTGLTGDAARRGIVFAGQSNSSGRTTATPTYTNTIKLLKNSGTYGNYTDPFDDDTGNLFANSLLADAAADTGYAGYCIDDLADDGEEYFACPANKGGTAIASWQPFAAGIDADNVIQDQAYAFIRRIQMATHAAGGRLPVVVWHQGETDAINGTTAAAYKAAWKELMDEARAAVGNFPIVALSLHEWNVGISPSVSEANWNVISDALLDLPSEYSNTYGLDISEYSGQGADLVHLSDTSNQGIGVDISNLIQANNLL